jgi:hypothetical protein
MRFPRRTAGAVVVLAMAVFLCLLPAGRFSATSNAATSLTGHGGSLSEASYYAAGFSWGKAAKPQAIAALVRFEADIQPVYAQLADDLAHLDDQPSSRIWRELYLRHAVRLAGYAMRDAQKAFLQSIGRRAWAGVPQLLGTYSFSSAELAYLQANEFNGLLAGVAAAVDGYVLSRIQSQAVNGLPDVFFPSLCFARVEKTEKSYRSADVTAFLVANPFRNLAIDSLFDPNYSGGPRAILTESRMYSMTGARPSCGLDGEIDTRSGQPTVVLFADDVAQVAYVKKHPELAPALFNETAVHEVLHTIAKNSCAGLGTREVTVGNVVYSRRRINEALATIGTIAVMASTKNEFSYVTLFNQLILAGTYNYGLTFDLFYKELFSGIAKRRFGELKRAADSGKSLNSSDVPPYMKLSERPASTDIGALKIDGRNWFVSVPYTYANLAPQFDPLVDVSNGEVLRAAERALTTIRDAQLSLCGDTNDQPSA